MDEELFLIGRINGTTSLCVSPVSSKTFALAELDNLGGDRGYFLYEIDERPIVGGMQILGKVASLDAAFRLSEIWKAVSREHSVRVLPVPSPSTTNRRTKRKPKGAVSQHAI
jgi:hypothetical protein